MDPSAERAHKLHAMKKKAINYYQNNGAPAKMEESLNKMFHDNPDCIYGYLSKFFENLANRPTISNITATQSLDTRNVPTISVKISCTFCNLNSQYADITIPLEVRSFDHDKLEDKEKEEVENSIHLEKAIEMINEGFLYEMKDKHFDPKNQSEIDDFLICKLVKEEINMREEIEKQLESQPENEENKEKIPEKAAGSAKKKAGGKKELVIIPDEPKEGLFPGCMAISAVSMASSLAGARSLNIELYEHIHRLATEWDSEKPITDKSKLPLPMITILGGGKSNPGKSNGIKEYMIVPKPNVSFREIIDNANAIIQHILKNLSGKGSATVRYINEYGHPNVTLDKPETGFDLINDALTKLELKDSYNLAINVAGHEIFDYDKGKYEIIQGTMKFGEELADYLDDLVNKQPSIIAIIDPFRRVEKDAWLKLCDKVSERCLVIADQTQQRPGLILQEEAGNEMKVSGWCARFQQRNTVTEVLQCHTKHYKNNQVTVVSAGPSDTLDANLIDLAVGMQARYVRIGSPLRSEKLAKLLRLQHIGEQLQSNDELEDWEEQEFQSIKIPKLDVTGSEKSQQSHTSMHSNKSKGKK